MCKSQLLSFITVISCICTGTLRGVDIGQIFEHSTITKALKASKHSGLPVIAFIYTDWSIPSQRMMNSTFQDESIINVIRNDYESVAINGKRKKKFCSEYEIHVFPTLMILDWEGNVIIRSKDYKNPAALLKTIALTQSKSKYLKQNLDSIAHTADKYSILNSLDSVKYYKGENAAKNLAKIYLDKKTTDWRDPSSMVLIKDYFQTDRKYLRFISKYHFKFFERFDSLSIKENIAFHVYLKSVKTDRKGRTTFNFKPVKKWFRKHRIDGVDKLENFVKIKYRLWGRGPTMSYSVNLLNNYPETSDDNVLYASVIRILLNEKRRRPVDYDELIKSIKRSITEDGSFGRYDLISLLYYKQGNDIKCQEYIETAKTIAISTGKEYTPTLDHLKDVIPR